MTYEYTPQGGSTLSIENEGGQTTVHLGSSSAGQQQGQSTSFNTGEWSGEPTLFQKGQDLLVVLPTRNGDQGLRVSGTQIQHEQGSPATDGAEQLSFRKTDGKSTPKMKPMEPMKPMAPMKPMEPMKPMKPMS